MPKNQWGDPAGTSELDQPSARDDNFSSSDYSYSSFSNPEELQLADELLYKGYHPVLIFGTVASGKTSLLASLLHYLNFNPDSPAIYTRTEWIVPVDSQYGKSVADAVTYFLNTVVVNFNHGETAPRTSNEQPFYIPLTLRPSNGQPDVKIAFLESRGEWYHLNKNSNDLFPKLRQEVADIYLNYTKSISILLIAPYVIGDAYSDTNDSNFSRDQMRDSDTALYAALSAYQERRGDNRKLDKYLFILTKWDAHTRAITDEFIRPPKGLVSNLIHERYPMSWALFQNMQTTDAQCMQYCSGLMSGVHRINVLPHQIKFMNQFPQVLWRWLYLNASDGQELFDESLKFNSDAALNNNGFLSFIKKIFLLK